MKIKSLILAIGLIISLTITAPSLASTNKLSMSIVQTPSNAEILITMYGTLAPNIPGTRIGIQLDKGGVWETTRFSTKVTKVGTWKVLAIVTSLNTKVRYRAYARIDGKNIYSSIREMKIDLSPEQFQMNSGIDALGAGGRILGADISRWQHPNDAQVDFVKMFQAGIRFVFIKASDTRDSIDQISLKYAAMDHHAAQAAGIYTGFYHYAVLPDVSTDYEIEKDALVQAQKVIWRLASMGGYGPRDFPYALDLENNCVRISQNGSCQKYASRRAVTLWATTFLASVHENTNKIPILYSYPNFLESAMLRSTQLAKYPLWLAQYAIDPENPINQPGIKIGGCFVHSWTGANCDSQWTLWQYTSCGIAPKYGVPGTRLDLNLFRGSTIAFQELASGTWVPELHDVMPVQEPTVLTVLNQSSSTSNKFVTFKVTVNRPNGSPVVTGDVKIVLNEIGSLKLKLEQSILRETSGVWRLAIKSMPPGTYSGNVRFQDISGTHAASAAPVSFTITQRALQTLKPSPTPTKKPTGDGCLNQIRH